MFDKKAFSIHAGYITYNGKFVARFKYRARNARGFASFIAANFTPAEYFARMDAGELPLIIAQSKGFAFPAPK